MKPKRTSKIVLAAFLALAPWMGACSGSSSSSSGNGTANTPPLQVTTASLPDGTVGQAYQQQLSATGGVKPYSWSTSSGSLPAGLSLNPSGAISGSPKGAGASSFVVSVSDSSVNTATANLTIAIGSQGSASACGDYVSPTGSDAASGSLSSPWQTLQHAFNLVLPGQVVCLSAGDYPMTVTTGYNQILRNSGTASQPIIFTNYPGQVAVVQGNTEIQAAFVQFIGNSANGGGLVFEGPTGQPLGVIDVLDSHDVTFNNIEIRDGDYHAGFYQLGGYDIRLVNSYIHDNGSPGQVDTDNGIYWDATTGGGNLIANNVIEHNVASGIQLYPGPSNVTVEDNTIVNNGNWVALYGSNDAFVNNIVADNGYSGERQIDIEGTGYTVNSNLVWSSQASLLGWILNAALGVLNGTGQNVTNLIAGNPLFIDPAAHNYQVSAGSPAIRAGNCNFMQPADKNGAPRACPPTLGAYQFQ